MRRTYSGYGVAYYSKHKAFFPNIPKINKDHSNIWSYLKVLQLYDFGTYYIIILYCNHIIVKLSHEVIVI